MRTSKFFPTPAELRQNITRSKIEIETPPPKAIEAPKTDKAREYYYLGELCKFVGLGYEEPDNNADLNLYNFLPYEQ